MSVAKPEPCPEQSTVSALKTSLKQDNDVWPVGAALRAFEGLGPEGRGGDNFGSQKRASGRSGFEAQLGRRRGKLRKEGQEEAKNRRLLT